MISWPILEDVVVEYEFVWVLCFEVVVEYEFVWVLCFEVVERKLYFRRLKLIKWRGGGGGYRWRSPMSVPAPKVCYSDSKR